MTEATLLGLTKISHPSIDMTDDVEVTGEARIIDSLGQTLTACFYDVTGGNRGIVHPLGVKDGGDFNIVESDDHEDGEVYVSGPYVVYLDDMTHIEKSIATAIGTIERQAALAAEDAWNQVWVDAAVAAESV